MLSRATFNQTLPQILAMWKCKYFVVRGSPCFTLVVWIDKVILSIMRAQPIKSYPLPDTSLSGFPFMMKSNPSNETLLLIPATQVVPSCCNKKISIGVITKCTGWPIAEHCCMRSPCNPHSHTRHTWRNNPSSPYQAHMKEQPLIPDTHLHWGIMKTLKLMLDGYNGFFIASLSKVE